MQDGRRIRVAASNVDSQGRPRDQTFMKIDAQSQTSLNEFDKGYNLGGDSVSPERNRKPTEKVHEYTLQQKSRVGAGKGIFGECVIQTNSAQQHPRSERFGSNLNNDQARQDRPTGAYCEIGINREDRELSSIEPINEDISASKSANFVSEVESEEAKGPADRKNGSVRALTNQ